MYTTCGEYVHMVMHGYHVQRMYALCMYVYVLYVRLYIQHTIHVYVYINMHA